MLPPLKPIAMKERVSMVFIEKGQIDVKDGAFVVIDETGIRTHIPVGSIACIMLEPGTRVSHHAAALAARAGTLLVWVGEAGVRLYASGEPGGARADRLLYQAKLALDDAARLKVVRKMYEIRFGEKPPERRSVEQLRGIEGSRVKKLYDLLAKQAGVEWKGRTWFRSLCLIHDHDIRACANFSLCFGGQDQSLRKLNLPPHHQFFRGALKIKTWITENLKLGEINCLKALSFERPLIA